jgi:hypothetical protein
MMDFKTEAILALAKATILEVSFMDSQPDERLSFDRHIIMEVFTAAQASGIIDPSLVCQFVYCTPC